MAEPFGNAGTVALVVALMPYELVDAFALDLFTLFQLGPTAGYLADHIGWARSEKAADWLPGRDGLYSAEVRHGLPRTCWMATLTKSRRRQPRYRIDRDRGVRVEFAHAGRRYDFAVDNVSASGVSFAADEPGAFADLEPGLGLPDAVLCLGDCTIRGDLLVMHLTDRGASRICGALFYPATDGDLVKLKSAIAGMDAAR